MYETRASLDGIGWMGARAREREAVGASWATTRPCVISILCRRGSCVSTTCV